MFYNSKGVQIHLSIHENHLEVLKKTTNEIKRSDFIGCRFYKKNEITKPKLELIYSRVLEKKKE